MKRLIGTLLATTFMASVSLADDTIETREITRFASLEASGNFTLVFTPSDEASIRFEGDVSDIDEIEIDVDGDELEIRQHAGLRRWFGGYNDLDVTVYVSGPDVEQFSLSRGITARLNNLVENELNINVSTGANVDASGNCVSARINTSTGSDFDGREFFCDTIRANASTGSDATFNARTTLSANVSTGASIRSITEPESLRMNTSTGGNVRVGSR